MADDATDANELAAPLRALVAALDACFSRSLQAKSCWPSRLVSTELHGPSQTARGRTTCLVSGCPT